RRTAPAGDDEGVGSFDQWNSVFAERQQLVHRHRQIFEISDERTIRIDDEFAAATPHQSLDWAQVHFTAAVRGECAGTVCGIVLAKQHLDRLRTSELLALEMVDDIPEREIGFAPQAEIE